MHKERDPRVVAVAEKLALAYPYGFVRVKNGPSAADYHAALIAVQTLDDVNDVEWEYNIQTTDDDGEVFIYFAEWSLRAEGVEKDLAELVQWDKDVDTGYSRALVRRRRAGKVEVVE